MAVRVAWPASLSAAGPCSPLDSCRSPGPQAAEHRITCNAVDNSAFPALAWGSRLAGGAATPRTPCLHETPGSRAVPEVPSPSFWASGLAVSLHCPISWQCTPTLCPPRTQDACGAPPAGLGPNALLGNRPGATASGQEYLRRVCRPLPRAVLSAPAYRPPLRPCCAHHPPLPGPLEQHGPAGSPRGWRHRTPTSSDAPTPGPHGWPAPGSPQSCFGAKRWETVWRCLWAPAP